MRFFDVSVADRLLICHGSQLYTDPKELCYCEDELTDDRELGLHMGTGISLAINKASFLIDLEIEDGPTIRLN